MVNESFLTTILAKSGFTVPSSVRFGYDEVPQQINFFPVALKIESSKVVHKSDVGGVILNITSYDELLLAKEKMIVSLRLHGVELDVHDHFLCTQMVSGIELYAGIIDDPSFGKVILFGAGGIFLELYKDRCFIDSGASKEEIIRSMETTSISKIFHGFRSMNFSLDTIVDFIIKLQDFIVANPSFVEIDFNPIILNNEGLYIVDARAKEGTNNVIVPNTTQRHNFFKHQTIAIIGASIHECKVGHALAKNSLTSHCDVFFVNSKGGELFGKKLYTSLEQIPSDIDTVVITTPSGSLLAMLDELKQKNVKNMIVISAGFKEVGDNRGEQILKEFAAKEGINIIGPNCLGYYNAAYNLNLTFGTSTVYSGDLAVVSQSGAVLSALMDKAAQSGVGFSHLISVGNMVDLDFATIIKMLDQDDTCQTIGLYVEGITNGKEFLAALRGTKKPVIVFKTGKSELSKKAAFSHTGNLSGNYPLFTGLVKCVGCVIVPTIESLIYRQQTHQNGVLIITNAGGPGSILTDLIIDAGKSLYELTGDDMCSLSEVLPFNWSKSNPVDIIGDALSQRFEDALIVAQKCDNVSLIFLVVTPQLMTDVKAIALLLTQKWSKTVIPIFLGGAMVDEGVEICKKEKILYFTSLQEAMVVL